MLQHFVFIISLDFLGAHQQLLQMLQHVVFIISLDFLGAHLQLLNNFGEVIDKIWDNGLAYFLINSQLEKELQIDERGVSVTQKCEAKIYYL